VEANKPAFLRQLKTLSKIHETMVLMTVTGATKESDPSGEPHDGPTSCLDSVQGAMQKGETEAEQGRQHKLKGHSNPKKARPPGSQDKGQERRILQSENPRTTEGSVRTDLLMSRKTAQEVFEGTLPGIHTGLQPVPAPMSKVGNLYRVQIPITNSLTNSSSMIKRIELFPSDTSLYPRTKLKKTCRNKTKHLASSNIKPTMSRIQSKTTRYTMRN
jgi:hypothetical protein